MLPNSVAMFFHVSDCAAISSALPVRPLRASLSGPTCSINHPTPVARIAPNGSIAIDRASRAVPTAPIATEAQSPLSIADFRSAADSNSETPEYAVVESLVSATNGLLIRPPPQSPDRPRSSHQNTPRRADREGLMITGQPSVPRVASRSTTGSAGPGSPADGSAPPSGHRSVERNQGHIGALSTTSARAATAPAWISTRSRRAGLRGGAGRRHGGHDVPGALAPPLVRAVGGVAGVPRHAARDGRAGRPAAPRHGDVVGRGEPPRRDGLDLRQRMVRPQPQGNPRRLRPQ